MDTINIRKATANDLEKLLVFEQGVISAERPFDLSLKPGPINYYDLKSMLTASHVHLVVAEIDNKIIASGYARIEESKPYVKYEHYAYLGFMYVLPEYRGKGINKLIIDELKTWAVTKGLTEIRLEVYYENEPAIKAYEKIGFKKHMIEMRFNLSE